MYRIGQVAAQLDVSPSTVRRWSDSFAGWLSDAGGNPERLDNGRRATRLYSDEDVALLAQVQRLKETGLSDEEIEAQLGRAAEPPELGLALLPRRDGELVVSGEAEAAFHMLQQAVESQKAIISAQQAQRDLLNLVIGDAMGLKEDNERLRRRLRMMEEEMSRLKESDWNHRLTLEERMSQLEREQHDARQKRSWWQRLFQR